MVGFPTVFSYGQTTLKVYTPEQDCHSASGIGESVVGFFTRIDVQSIRQ